MWVRAEKKTNLFTFHADELGLHSVPEVVELPQYHHVKERYLEVGKVIYDLQRTFYHLELRNGSFTAGHYYKISMSFFGKDLFN